LKPFQDTFGLYHEAFVNETQTRRTVFSTISRVFDSLGLISPIVIRCKIFLQNLTLFKLDWDEPLEGILWITWESLQGAFKNISNLCIPIFSHDSKVLNFADASERAYGCCVYIRAMMTQGIKVNLLMAKSRVALIKVQTLPKLKLCAAVLLHRTRKWLRR